MFYFRPKWIKIALKQTQKEHIFIETLVGFVLEEPHYHSVLWGILAILPS